MKTTRTRYEIKAQAGADEAEILIYDDIGSGGLFWDEVGVKDFVEQLKAITASTIAVRINSRGGSVFDGAGIYNAIRRHPAAVTTYIDGFALSIAGVIALAGDRVVMAPTAWFMIHDPWGFVEGTAADMRTTANALDKVAATIRDVYVAKTGMKADEVAAAMGAETWYTADEALAAGFVDEVSDGSQAQNAFELDFAAYGYHNPPKALAPDEDPADAGRVLSQVNYDKLQQAADLISEVLTSADGGQAAATDSDATMKDATASSAEEPAGEAAEGSQRAKVSRTQRAAIAKHRD